MPASEPLAAPRPEYPRPTAVRERWLSLNGAWRFGLGEAPRFDRTIRVPKLAPGDVAAVNRRGAGSAAAETPAA